MHHNDHCDARALETRGECNAKCLPPSSRHDNQTVLSCLDDNVHRPHLVDGAVQCVRIPSDIRNCLDVAQMQLNVAGGHGG